MRYAILALTLAASAALAADKDGLVGMWKFDEGQGATVADSSGNGNNGKFVGGVTWTKGVSGGALQFNGADSYVEIPASKSMDLKALTMAAWINVETYSGVLCFSTGSRWEDERAVIHFYDGHDPKTGGFMFTISDGTTYPGVLSNSPVPLKKWVHVAVTFDGRTMTAYLDGQPTGSADVGITPNTKDVPFKIGRVEGLAPDFFQGSIDQVALYNRALSADEVRKLAEKPAAK